jgi:hypothetical protein
VVWRIDQPNVRQGETEYPSITFRQGDLISVFAGGCVQIGGGGLTWKRYVNPTARSKGDDDQYHGLIHLPGFVGLQHIRNTVLNGGWPVNADPGTDRHLHLGYVDDGYGNNGYWGHDDGWWEQCNDLPNAWVTVVIQHGCAASASKDCIRGRAMDLVVDQTDPNGFPLNPNWVYTVLTGTAPVPTDVCSWSTKIGGFPVDDASLCASELTERDSYWACVQGGTPGAISGHMNWIAQSVAYQGWVWWDGHDYRWDDDYTWNMAALNSDGSVSGALFVASQNNPQIEFDADETVDHFSGAPWWNKLQGAVGTEDNMIYNGVATVTGALMPSDLFPPGGIAIVIGQLGMDCGHSCGTELHPAWAVFVHTKDDPNDDVWAFFVRNWGDEGFCGRSDHQPGGQQTFLVRIPRPGATDVALKTPDTVVGATGAVAPVQLAMAPGNGAALASFTLPPAQQHVVIYGELHLRWKHPLPLPIITLAAEHLAFLRSARHNNSEESITELLAARVEALPAASHAAFVAPKRDRMEAANVSRVPVRVVRTLPPAKATASRVLSAPDPALTKRQQLQSNNMTKLLEMETKERDRSN